MAKISAFEDLEVWKEAVRIGVEIYRLADLSPLKNDYKSRDQIKVLQFLYQIILLKALNTTTIKYLSNIYTMPKDQLVKLEAN